MLSPETQKRLKEYDLTEAQFIEALRLVFPHGHIDYLPTAVKELELHSAKNHDYAKGGSALGNFDRVAAILALYPGLNLGDRRVVALTYALKQLDAVLWGLCKKIVHKVEGLNERLQDIAVYAKIVMCMNIEDARNNEIDRQFGVDLNELDKKMAAAGLDKLYPYPLKTGQHSRVEVSAQGRNEVESEPAYRQRMRFDDVPKQPTCPELNQTRDREDRKLGYPPSARGDW